jgi:hypothetical protein
MTSPRFRCWLLTSSVVLVASAGCYRVRSELITTAAPPEDLFRCVQLELGRAGYVIVGADRESGWLHAQRRIERFFDVDRAEIYATVIPAEAGNGAHLQLTDNSHAAEDADHIRAACIPNVVAATN